METRGGKRRTGVERQGFEDDLTTAQGKKNTELLEQDKAFVVHLEWDRNELLENRKLEDNAREEVGPRGEGRVS